MYSLTRVYGHQFLKLGPGGTSATSPKSSTDKRVLWRVASRLEGELRGLEIRSVDGEILESRGLDSRFDDGPALRLPA